MPCYLYLNLTEQSYFPALLVAGIVVLIALFGALGLLIVRRPAEREGVTEKTEAALPAPEEKEALAPPEKREELPAPEEREALSAPPSPPLLTPPDGK